MGAHQAGLAEGRDPGQLGSGPASIWVLEGDQGLAGLGWRWEVGR